MRTIVAALIAVGICVPVYLLAPQPPEPEPRVVTQPTLVAPESPVMAQAAESAVAHAELEKRMLITAYVVGPPTTTTRPRTPAEQREQEPNAAVEHDPATRSSDCAYGDLIRSVFGADGEWAVDIAWRESRCQPGARHPEGASGLLQLMLPLHNDLFGAVGCSPSQWSDPSCNVRAAYHLFRSLENEEPGSGKGPWRL